jgi:hypothetical protein
MPFSVKRALRPSIYGRPGARYLDIADDIITGGCDVDKAMEVGKCPDPPRMQTMPEYIEQALNVLQSAERPLVIIGKGMASSRAEDEVRAFIEKTQLPFLASPMGKGVMPDDHPLSVGASRSLALQQADVVFLMGARFNWIMHFGLPPRYNKDVRVIQLDIEPEATNGPAELRWGYGKGGALNQASGGVTGSIRRSAVARGDHQAIGKTALIAQPMLALGGLLRRTCGPGRQERDHLPEGASDHRVPSCRISLARVTPAAMARWASGLVSSSPPASCIPTSRSSTCRVTRRSASPAWRWRRCAVTGCRRRSSYSTTAASGRAWKRSRTTRCSICGRTR